MIKKHLCLIFCLAWFLMLFYPLITPACPSERIQKTKYTYIVCKLKTPRKLVWYNFYHFDYKSDIKQFGVLDYWQEPLQFWVNKLGDCEDFAIWNYHVLKHHGYKPQIIIVKNKESGRNHTLVRVIIKNGRIRYVDAYNYFKKLPKYWELVRVLNKPYESKVNPIQKENEKDSIILREGEMIKIKK